MTCTQEHTIGKAPHAQLGVALAVGTIFVFTLFPSPDNEAGGWVSCFACGTRGVADVILNIALFVPFGVALALAGLRPWRIWLLGVLLSAGVEYAQLFIPGRDSSLADVITNSTGALVGGAVALTFVRITRGALPPSLLQALVASGLEIVVIAATGFLLQPAFPASTYFGQWTPNLGHLDWYRGRVIHASVDDVPLPPGPLTATARVRALLAAGHTLRVLAVAGPPTSRLAPLFSIFDEHEREILLLGPDRDDLVFRYRTRAAAWHLDGPEIRIPRAMASVRPGDTLAIAVQRRGHAHCLTLNHVVTCHAGFTAGSGWAVLMYPERLPGRLGPLLGVCWIAGLLLGAGFWGASRWGMAIAAATAAIGLGLVPAAAGLSATPLGEWVGAFFGLAAGAAARTALQRRQGRHRDAAPGMSERTSSPRHRSILA